MRPDDKYHFVGVGGVGMSALAQFHALGGGSATGSDRLADRGEAAELQAKLGALGIRFFPQDGSGIDRATRRVVVSTAIEGGNPDLVRAAELGIPVSHRAELLAEHVAAHRTIAVAGTSGKSTVTAMIYEILAFAGASPSLISGAALVSLAGKGGLGNAARGSSGILVVEADESDGTLPKYRPELGVLLNMGKDHKELEELYRLFSDFRAHARSFLVNADAANLAGLRSGAETFGFSAGSLRGEELLTDGTSTRFRADGVSFTLPWPGRHNAENALAAAAAARVFGVPLKTSAGALAAYRGVARRFERVGAAAGVEVIDDFAHNPDKVRAALGAAHLRASRVLAVFQLHGYFPARFLKEEFIAAFAEALSPGDALWLAPIYYVGGTTAKDVSPEDIAAPLRARGRDARCPSERRALVGEIVRAARPGDLVLVMGARDPGLSAFARDILAALGAETRRA